MYVRPPTGLARVGTGDGMPVTLYALHYGTRRNQFYGLYTSVPQVQTREVRDDRTGKTTVLYESPDKLELNLCVTQFERLTGVSVPLGALCEVTLEARPCD